MVACKVTKILIGIVCVVFALNIVLFYNAHHLPFSVSNKVTEGMPYHFLDSRKYWSEITDVLACGDYLYVMYDSKKVLTCYDLDGNYSHSFAFSMAKNGRTELYSINGLLYVVTKGNDLYIFDNGQFISYCPLVSRQVVALRATKSDMWDEQPENRIAHYELQNASVWRIADGEKIEVLHRSDWLMLFQGPTQIVIHGLCLISLALLCYKK